MVLSRSSSHRPDALAASNSASVSNRYQTARFCGPTSTAPQKKCANIFGVLWEKAKTVLAIAFLMTRLRFESTGMEITTGYIVSQKDHHRNPDPDCGDDLAGCCAFIRTQLRSTKTCIGFRYFQCARFGTTASICARTCSAGQASLAICSTQKSIRCSLLVYRNSPSA